MEYFLAKILTFTLSIGVKALLLSR